MGQKFCRNRSISKTVINSHPSASISQLGECQLLGAGAGPVQLDWLNSALSPVVYGDIALSINTQ